MYFGVARYSPKKIIIIIIYINHLPFPHTFVAILLDDSGQGKTGLCLKGGPDRTTDGPEPGAPARTKAGLINTT